MLKTMIIQGLMAAALIAAAATAYAATVAPPVAAIGHDND